MSNIYEKSQDREGQQHDRDPHGYEANRVLVVRFVTAKVQLRLSEEAHG